MSLRLRLTLLMIVLSTIGLAAAGSLNVVRLNNTLETGVGARIEGLPVQDIAGLGAVAGNPNLPIDLADVLPDDWIVAFVPPDGPIEMIYGEETGGVPDLEGVDSAELAEGGQSVSVERMESDDRVRVALYELERLPGAWVVVGASLSEVDATIEELVRITILVSAAVLAVIAALSWALIGVALRPLTAVSQTAAKIADGGLGARAPEIGPTEVARVGIALNAMLDSVEGAFDRQRASEEQLRQFLGDATHELRAPLTNIQGYAGLFRRGGAADPAELAVMLDRIESEAARMGDLLTELTDLADHDEGRQLDSELVEVSGIVREVAAALRSRQPDRPVVVDCVEAWVLGDRRSLERMIRNLVDNAADHTPETSAVDLSVSIEGRHAVITVADRGPGMTEEVTARVFERFFTAGAGGSGAARTPRMQGRGLGLSIVQAVVTAHNGTCEVDSDPEAGTTFVVELPAVDGGSSARDEVEAGVVGNARLEEPVPPVDA